MKFITENSYGAIPLLRQGKWGYRILLVRHALGYWGLPKGHPEKKKDGTKETPLETAIRELYEEAGIINARFDTRITFMGRYRYQREHNLIVDKQVIYYPAWVSSEIARTPKEFAHEIIASRWCSFDEAIVTLKHPDYQRIIESLRKYVFRYSRQVCTA